MIQGRRGHGYHQRWMLGTDNCGVAAAKQEGHPGKWLEIESGESWGREGRSRAWCFGDNWSCKGIDKGIPPIFSISEIEIEIPQNWKAGLLMARVIPKWIIGESFPKAEQMIQMNKMTQKDRFHSDHPTPPLPCPAMPCLRRLWSVSHILLFQSPHTPFLSSHPEQFKFHCFSKGFLQKLLCEPRVLMTPMSVPFK